MSRREVNQQLDDIEAEIKEHTKILASVDKTLALQAQQLENHMRRTEIVEENIELLRKEFRPVQAQSEFVRRLSRLVVVLFGLCASCGGIASAVYYILKLLGRV